MSRPAHSEAHTGSDPCSRSSRERALPDTDPFQPSAAPTPALRVPPPEGAPEVPPQLAEHPRYRILAWLGAGGMGTVYQARHRFMNRVVALKVINPALVDRPLMVERFRREVEAAARLAHPNIVTAFDADQAGPTHFLVMEYVEGINLDRVLAEQGPLPVERACDYARQAALGLQHAHERGMVHRDVKPHNLMLTPDGQVKILDFGLTRYALEAWPAERSAGAGALSDAGPGQWTGAGREDGTEWELTSACAGLGTADYVAPEVARNARASDVRADVYSLGCTLYQFLTGQVPFPGGTPADKARAHLEATPRPLLDLRPNLPAGLVGVVERMMARDPADRYQTPGEAARALAPFALPPHRHLLVVDDDPAMCQAVRQALEREGYAISGAANGREALAYLRTHSRPSLILLDLLMPVMDGWAFLRELHADPVLASIPVIIVSATDAVQAHGAVLGAAAYLHKPVPLEELADRVHRVDEGSVSPRH